MKIFLATPAYDGRVYSTYALSLLDTVGKLGSLGIQVQVCLTKAGSLLCAERNRIVKAFMQTDCTHAFFIDADIGWNVQTVCDMIIRDQEFIGGCYPARAEKKIFQFRPVFNENGSIKTVGAGLIEMEAIPAGFMFFRRSVIEKMMAKFPELYFKPKDERDEFGDGWCLFDTQLIDGEFWGEDYVFCLRAREAGVKIYCDPNVKLNHAGQEGCLMQVLEAKKQKNPPA